MAKLELKSVRKTFGSAEVIHGVDLAVEEGEFCVFVGPSGCGKSTLLRMIAGLEDITDGEVLIDGQRVNEDAASERKLAMVFQSYALYPHMSVAQNMSFALRMTGTSKADAQARVREAAETLQLTPLLDRKPAQLSGGQRQRVAIGRAIVRNPRAFLFDEPLSNLDAELRVQMRVEIAKLHQELDATMIYVTHDQIEAMTLADKIVVLREGRIEQMGAPNTLYADPDNLFVAGFIGSPKMNFIDARPVAGVDGSAMLELADGSRVGAPVPMSAMAGDDAVILGVRPEAFDAPVQDGDGIRLTIDVVENLGGTAILHGNMRDGHTVLVEERNGPSARVGDTIAAPFDPQRCFVFSRDGQRLRA